VQKEVCFVNVADRGLRPKRMFPKAKTPARDAGVPELGAILPKNDYTPGAAFCQGKS
jgi:hypothetical protein